MKKYEFSVITEKNPPPPTDSLFELIKRLQFIAKQLGDMPVAMEIKEPGFKINYRTDADKLRVTVDSSWNDGGPVCLITIVPEDL